MLFETVNFYHIFFFYPKGTKSPKVASTKAPKGTKSPKVASTKAPKGTKSPKVASTKSPKGTKSPKVASTKAPKGTKSPKGSKSPKGTKSPKVASTKSLKGTKSPKGSKSPSIIQDSDEEIDIDSDGVTVDEEELGADEVDLIGLEALSMPLIDEEASRDGPLELPSELIEFVYEDAEATEHADVLEAAALSVTQSSAAMAMAGLGVTALAAGAAMLL